MAAKKKPTTLGLALKSTTIITNKLTKLNVSMAEATWGKGQTSLVTSVLKVKFIKKLTT